MPDADTGACSWCRERPEACCCHAPPEAPADWTDPETQRRILAEAVPEPEQ
jgi:hypothetical protein